MRKGKLFFSLLILLVVMSFTIKPSYAFGGDIIQDDHTTVAKGQTVDNVVVFGSDAVIKGTVKGSVVVINGNLSVEKTAKIKDVVLVIGGEMTQEQGAKVTDEVYDFAFGNGASLGFIVAGVLLLTDWGLRLGISLLLIIMAILTLLLMRNKTEILTKVVKERPIKTLLIGAITSVLLIVVGALLGVSIVGIPLALLLIILWMIFFFMGITVISQMISRFIVGHDKRKPWLNGFYGSLVFVGFMNLPFLGWLLILGVFWFSTAFMILWAFRKIRFR
jgi:hypothetical protein